MLDLKYLSITLILVGAICVCCNSNNVNDGNIYDCNELVDSVPLSLDEVSEEFGFSAQEFLDAIDLSWETVIRIKEYSQIIANYPEEDTTQMTVSIEYKGGEIREAYGDPQNCPPAFLIEVEIRIITSCGLLDETWTGILETNSQWNPDTDPHEYVFLSADFDPSHFDGDFEITGVTDPEPEEIVGEFFTSFPPVPSGSISVHWSSNTGGASAYIFVWNNG